MTVREADILRCEDCGVTTLRKNAVQRFCPTCSSLRDLARKRKWVKEHPQERDPAKERDRRERRKELGAAASTENRSELLWVVNAEDDFKTSLRVVIPFNRRFSKNALWSTNSKGHVYMRQEIKAVRDDLVARIQRAQLEWFDGKVWIDIFVEKPNAKSDAINVIDLVCDAVKEGIGVDDRWFCIRRLDWSIVKEEPRIIIGILQEVEEDHRGCTYCGRILPLTEFGNNRAGLKGRSRACRGCQRILSRHQRERKVEEVR